jgi:hypothetical protein
MTKSEPVDQICAVAGVKLEKTFHLEESFVLRKTIAVEEVDQHFQDIEQSLEVTWRLFALKHNY